METFGSCAKHPGYNMVNCPLCEIESHKGRLLSLDWSQFKVRCSAIGSIMCNAQGYAPLTENQEKKVKELEQKEKDKGLTAVQQSELNAYYAKREMSKEVVLADTTITYLMEEYAWRVYRKKSVSRELDIEYTTKGKEVEGESIKLLSIYDGVEYFKNTERIENDFLSGEPDIYTGASIMAAESISELKSIWDYPGFLKKLHTDLNPDYIYQVRGYGDIAKTDKLQVVYCLVSMTDAMIFDYIQKLKYRMSIIWDEDPVFLQKSAELENSMRFEDIPIEKRIKKIPVEPFSAHEREKVYDKVKKCRDWLCKFDEEYQKLNKV